MPETTRTLICSGSVSRRAHGIAGLPKTTMIKEPCGRPAVRLIRGYQLRKDGSVFLNSWRPQCRACQKFIERGPPNGFDRWLAELIRLAPRLSRADVLRDL